MTKRYLLLFSVFFLIPVYASAHGGKAMELASATDVAKACGGESLKSDETTSKGSTIRWMKALREDGAISAIVGLDRVKTRHGYFVQATCIEDSGNIKSVVLMRAMGDEVGELRTAMKNRNWFDHLPGEKISAVVSELYRSVSRTKKAYAGLPAEEKL